MLLVLGLWDADQLLHHPRSLTRTQLHHSESEEELKSLLRRVKEESEKTSFDLNIQKTKIVASSPITSFGK